MPASIRRGAMPIRTHIRRPAPRWRGVGECAWARSLQTSDHPGAGSADPLANVARRDGAGTRVAHWAVMPTVSDHLLDLLTAWKVRRSFGFPGDGINGILGALQRVGKRSPD